MDAPLLRSSSGPAQGWLAAVAHRGAAALGVILVLSLVYACGSNHATEKLALAADTTTTDTKTVTEPARTVTAPARTETVTKTKTTTTPGATATIHSNTTTVAVKPTTSTSGGGSSGGIPSWGWVLIGAGAVLLVVAIFMIGRTHGERRRDVGPEPGPYPDQPPPPPRGPPEDRI